MNITIVVGNPKPQSRTRGVAERLVTRLFPGAEPRVIELADYAGEIFDWHSAAVAELNEAVVASDVVVFASPTYKATFTALLKAFLDRYQSDSLVGVVAIPLHTGGDLAHSMSATHELAPLLIELGAAVPGRGLYVPMTELERVDEIVDAAAAGYVANLRRLAGVAATLGE